MQQHGIQYPTRIPTPALVMGSISHNSTFSEHGHVAYQIKGNNKSSRMVANI